MYRIKYAEEQLPVAGSIKYASKKDKKSKNESTGPPSFAEIVVILTDEQAQKCLKGAKVITSSEVAKQCGVKISAASAYLKNAVMQGKI